MSTSGRKIFSQAVGADLEPDNSPVLLVKYTYQPWYGNVEGGILRIPITGRTESEINLLSQDAILARVQPETAYEENFVLADIIGGRV